MLSFYYINLTKKIETELKNAKLEMRYLEDKIQINNIEFVTIASAGNATDFGDRTVTGFGVGACSDVHGGLGD